MESVRILFFFASCLCVVRAAAEVPVILPKPFHTAPRIDFYPQELKSVVEEEQRHVSFGISWENATGPDDLVSDFHVSVVSENTEILEIVNYSYPECIRSRHEPKNFSFTVKGVFLGYTKVRVNLWPGCEKRERNPSEDSLMENVREFDLVVSVVRPPSVLVNIVTGVMAAMVAFNYINMGVQLDLNRIGKVLKKPIGPTIGFVCQFLFMPVASYGISLLLLDDVSLRLGLFTLGCSPGGSMSNFWTLLFNGDVNLSITMTFISTVAALAMMPLWIFTLGASLFRDTQATIPYINLAGSLVLLTLPIGLGLLIQHRSPRFTKISKKVIKPFTLVCVFVGVCFALYANSFVFSLFTWRVMLSAVGIAWGGYSFGALMAWAFRLERAQIIAVSIETAFQNPAVAFVMLLLSLPQPDADLTSVPVIAQLMLTGLPMWAMLAATKAYEKLKGCCSDDDGEIVEKPEIDTVQKIYFALDTNPPEDAGDGAVLEPWQKKPEIIRVTTS